MGSGRNSNSFKFLCMCLLSARMKEIQSKMNSLEWPYHFSHYESMGIFRFTQGQLTLQSLVRSTQNSKIVQTLWLSSIPKRMQKIQSKMKALEWPQDNMLIFFCAQWQITPKSVVGSSTNSSKFLCMCLLSVRIKKIR